MDDREVLAALAGGFEPAAQVKTGKWFGQPCLKVAGRVFAVLRPGEMAFRLPPAAREQALTLDGARPFDRQGRPLVEWVVLPAGPAADWPHYARLACDYVANEAAALKRALIDGLVAARQALIAAAGQLSPDQRRAVFLGSWGLRELLAHLAGWDETNRAAVAAILAGQRPLFWQEYDKDWAAYNARLVAEYRRESVDEMIGLQGDSHQRLIDYLESLPAALFLRHRSIGSLLRAEASDEQEHARQVRAFGEGR